MSLGEGTLYALIVGCEVAFWVQEAVIAQQQTQIEALTATVRKVSDQVALSKATPQLVATLK